VTAQSAGYKKKTRKSSAFMKKLELLSHAGQLSTSEKPLPEVLQGLLDIVLQLVEADHGLLLTLDPKKDELVAQARAGLPESVMSLRWPMGDGFIGLVAKDCLPLLVDDLQLNKQFRDNHFDNVQTSACMGVPLKVQDNIRGVLYLGRQPDSSSFDQENLRMTTMVASYASIIIENRRLYQDIDFLSRTGEKVNAILNVEEVLNAIVDMACEGLDAEMASLMLFEEHEPVMRIRAARGLDPHIIEIARARPGEGIAGWVALHGTPLLVTDIEKDPRFMRKSKKKYSTKSFLSVPMKVKDKVIGVLNVNNKKSGYVFTKDNLDFLSTLAHQAAGAIENARLYESLVKKQKDLDEQIEAISRAYEELFILHEIGTSITPVLSFGEIMENILEMLAGCVEATDVAIFLEPDQKDSLQVRKMVGVKDEGLIHRWVKRGEGVVGWVASTGMALMDTDREEIEKNKMFFLFDDLGKHFLCLPIGGPDNLMGVLLLISSKKTFYEEDRNLLTVISNRVYNVIENARLYKEALDKQAMERDMQLATDIQKRLLPSKLPTYPGIDIGAWNIPAKSVGGDYFDVLVLHDRNKLGLVVADVAGKGVSAAMIMSMTRSLLRAEAFDHDSPSKVLSSLNELLLGDIDPNLYVTMFYSTLDLGTLNLDYSKAGHNPPLIYHRKIGEFEPLDVPGLFLGMFEEGYYSDRMKQLYYGDTLILYTDGVIEACNHREEKYGLDRMKQIICDNPDLDAQSLVDKIFHSIQEYIGRTPLYDDLTLVIVNLFEGGRLVTEFLSERDQMGKQIEKIINVLECRGIPEETIFCLRIALEEAVTNAIEHGNKGDTSKKVWIDYETGETEVRFSIKDQGRGFNHKSRAKELESAEVLRDRGRGLIILRQLLDEVSFNEKGNEITMVKSLVEPE